MKVLKDGKFGDPANWGAVVTCHKRDTHDTEGCGAELEVAFSDLEPAYYKAPYSNKYYAVVRCPQCGKYNFAGRLPAPVYQRFYTPENRAKARFDGCSFRSE